MYIVLIHHFIKGYLINLARPSLQAYKLKVLPKMLFEFAYTHEFGITMNQGVSN